MRTVQVLSTAGLVSFVVEGDIQAAAADGWQPFLAARIVEGSEQLVSGKVVERCNGSGAQLASGLVPEDEQAIFLADVPALSPRIGHHAFGHVMPPVEEARAEAGVGKHSACFGRFACSTFQAYGRGADGVAPQHVQAERR